jgi:Signal peptidase I
MTDDEADERAALVRSLAREVLISIVIVAAVGLLLFAISGIWPPMVAVESGSMEPNMVRGDLIVVTAVDRFGPPSGAADTQVSTVATGAETGYDSFGAPGDVIIFSPPGRAGSPIIHRAHLWVETGEDWTARADAAHLGGATCAQITTCPAPHAGFITKGDANPQYDQVNGIAGPVRAGWVTGAARLRIPYLGHIRLLVS